MSDTHSKEQRSYNMSQIKGKDTKPELMVRKFLFSKGFRYRIHVKDLPGKPDIVLPKYKTIIFIHGCFWHGHEGCKYFVMPKSNLEYWNNKIFKNLFNDQKHKQLLIKRGWKVITIWECKLKKDKKDEILNELLSHLIV